MQDQGAQGGQWGCQVRSLLYSRQAEQLAKKGSGGAGGGHASQQSDNCAKVACCKSLKVGLHEHAKLVVQEFLIC